MTKLGVQKVLLVVAVAAAASSSGGRAHASGEGAFEKEKHESGNVEHASAHETGAHEGGEAKEEEEHSFYAGVDFVVGTAQTATVAQALPSSQQVLGTPAITTNKVTSYSFLLDAGYEFTRDFELRFRVPLETASIQDPGYPRGSGAFGNVEIEPEGTVKLAEGLHLKLGLGVALPTAQGTAVPDSADAVPVVGGGINQDGYDRFVAQRAAAMVRGYEENALFEPSHLGIVPKLTLLWSSDRFRIDPWVKLENLVATQSGEKFIDELVFGVNLGYRATRAFEPGVRVWANVPVTNADFTTVAVVEPQLKFHVGQLDASGSVILPFAGPLTSPYAFGVRFGVGLHF